MGGSACHTRMERQGKSMRVVARNIWLDGVRSDNCKEEKHILGEKFYY